MIGFRPMDGYPSGLTDFNNGHKAKYSFQIEFILRDHKGNVHMFPSETFTN